MTKTNKGAIDFTNTAPGKENYEKRFPNYKKNFVTPVVVQVSRFLEDKTLNIPGFQREYSWPKPTVRKFINKIKDKMHVEDLSGMITIVEQEDLKDIIDGQQRITTILLMLAACRDLSEEYAGQSIYKEHKVNLMNNVKFINSMLLKLSPANGEERVVIESNELGYGALRSILMNTGMKIKDVHNLKNFPDEEWRKTIINAYMEIRSVLKREKINVIDFSNKILFATNIVVYTSLSKDDGVEQFGEINGISHSIGFENTVRKLIYKEDDDITPLLLKEFSNLKTKLGSNKNFERFIMDMMKADVQGGEKITEGNITDYIESNYGNNNVRKFLDRLREKSELYEALKKGKYDNDYEIGDNKEFQIMNTLQFSSYIPIYLKISDIDNKNQRLRLFQEVRKVHFLLQTIMGLDARKTTTTTNKVLRLLRDHLSDGNRTLSTKAYNEAMGYLTSRVESVSASKIISSVDDFITSVTRNTAKGVYLALEYAHKEDGGKETFVVKKQIDADHYFAENLLKDKERMEEYGVDQELFKKYVNSLANFKPFAFSPNRSLKDAMPTLKNGDYRNSELIINKHLPLSEDNNFTTYFEESNYVVKSLLLSYLGVDKNNIKKAA